MPERAVGQNRVGIPSAWPSGSVRRRPRAHTDAPRAAMGTSASAIPTSLAQVDGLAPAAEEPVGAQVDDASPDVLTLQGATELRRRLEQGDRRRTGQRGRPTGQLPRRGQATDAAADDDHPPRRHVRAPRRRR